MKETKDTWDRHSETFQKSCFTVFCGLVLMLICVHIARGQHLYALPTFVSFCFLCVTLAGRFNRESYNIFWNMLHWAYWEYFCKFYIGAFFISIFVSVIRNWQELSLLMTFGLFGAALSGLIVMAVVFYLGAVLGQRLKERWIERTRERASKEQQLIANLVEETEKLEALLAAEQQKSSIARKLGRSGQGFSRYHALSGMLKVNLDDGALPFPDAETAYRFKTLVENFFIEHDKTSFDKLVRLVRGASHPDRLRHDDVAPILNASIDEIKQDGRYIV